MKKRNLTIVAIIAASFILTACGAGGALGGSPKITVKTGAATVTADVKSGGVYFGNMISTTPGKPPIQTFAHSVYIANYEMDTTSAATMQKPLSAPEQVRVQFTLHGEEGTKDDSPFKVGEYKLKAERFNKIGVLRIWTFADGKEKTDGFDAMSSASKAEGTIKITSVTADAIAGEIDVTEGDKSVKGTFTAKLPVKK